MIRLVTLAAVALSMMACVRMVGDFPASVGVEGRTYLASGGTTYGFDPTQLKPYRVAERVDLPGANGRAVFELAGVDPHDALVIPMVAGFGRDYELLLPVGIVQSRLVDDDFGITGLCRYRVVRQDSCP